MRVYTSLAMEFRKFIAKRLKEARMERGYSQIRLAQLSGVHDKAIAKYEGGVIIPTAETLKKLSAALEVSADYFLFDHAQMKGIPKVNDPVLYERYFVLETLDADERDGAITLLNALIASHRLREIATTAAQATPVAATKKPNPKEAHA